MAFHISGKIGVPVGIALLLLGVGITVSSFSIFEEAENIEDFMTEPSSEITKEFTDEDGEGSAGWYIMIQGDYFVDNNENGILDACEGLNLTVTDPQGDIVTDMTGTVYCELDGKSERGMSELDNEHVDPKDEWIIVGIFCDTLDDAGMNGYYETSRNADGEERENWVQTGENDRCKIGDEYTFNLNYENLTLATPDMVLFDRDAQAALEVEGFFTLCGGICCAICSLLLVVVSSISGITMNPGTSALATMELSGASPAPVSGEGTPIPGTTQGSVFGAGPAAEPMVVPLAEESEDEPIESSVDALKKQFLAGTEKLAESEKAETEVEKE